MFNTIQVGKYHYHMDSVKRTLELVETGQMRASDFAYPGVIIGLAIHFNKNTVVQIMLDQLQVPGEGLTTRERIAVYQLLELSAHDA